MIGVIEGGGYGSGFGYGSGTAITSTAQSSGTSTKIALDVVRVASSASRYSTHMAVRHTGAIVSGTQTKDRRVRSSKTKETKMNLKPVGVADLDILTLGPDFKGQTPQSFHDYVRSLRIEAPVKAARVPKIKLPPKPHSLDPVSKKCTVCEKKPRKAEGKCSGPKKVKE